MPKTDIECLPASCDLKLASIGATIESVNGTNVPSYSPFIPYLPFIPWAASRQLYFPSKDNSDEEDVLVSPPTILPIEPYFLKDEVLKDCDTAPSSRASNFVVHTDVELEVSLPVLALETEVAMSSRRPPSIEVRGRFGGQSL